MDVTEAIRTRLDIREFTDESVDDETKRAILEAGRLAPSGKNLQHWAFILVDDPANVERLAEASTSGRWVHGADFAVVLLTDPQYPYHEIDAGRALTYMQFEAWNHGVASCIYTGYDEGDMQTLLDHPESMAVTLVAGFGHPTRPVDSFAGTKDRAALSEVVHHGSYGRDLSL